MADGQSVRDCSGRWDDEVRLRPAVSFPHRWTPEGVTVEADFTGGHLLHLAAAGCVLNDIYREAAELGIEVKGVRVCAAGGLDTGTWKSTGVSYSVDISSNAPAGELAHLLEVVGTRSPRFHVLSGPAPLSGVRPESCPAVGDPSQVAPAAAEAGASGPAGAGHLSSGPLFIESRIRSLRRQRSVSRLKRRPLTPLIAPAKRCLSPAPRAGSILSARSRA